MASKITTVQANMLPELSDIVQPLSSKSLFWQATYLTGSDAIDCLPFLFWTVESAAPRTLVSLAGDASETAESYFAMCLAVERLSLETRCFNISPDDPDIAVKRHNADNFEDFSLLLVEPQSTAASRFDPQSIDFLYLDLARLPDDLAIWHDKLSPRSVLLIHGVSNPNLTEARKACLDQLRIKQIDFSLMHGNGIGMVLGPEAPARLERLSHLKLGVPGYSQVQKVFFRLGKAHANAHLAKEEHSKRIKQKKEIAHLQQETKETRESFNVQTEKNGKLRAAYEARNQQIAATDARHFDEVAALEDALGEAEETCEQTAQALARMTQKAGDTAALERQLAAAQQAAREPQNQIEMLSDTTARQDKELAELIQKFEERRTEHENKLIWLRDEIKKYKGDEAKYQTAITAKTKETDTLKADLAKARAQVENMLDKKTAQAETAALHGEIKAYKSAEMKLQAELATKTNEVATQKAELAKARKQSENILDKKTAQAEIASLNAKIETQINELVELTRLFEIEKASARNTLSGQKSWQAIQIELRDAEIAMLRAGQSRLRRGDASSRAGLPSVKTQIETVRKSDLFDAGWYLKTYPDVAQSKVDPARHYVLHGALDGRNPGPGFDTVAYYVANRDVARRGFNALVHYALFGKDENRKPYKVS
jgi:hypothetical protein